MDEQTFKSLSEAERKAEQRRLQILGLYTGEIDGKWGNNTAAAVARSQQMERERQTAERDAQLKQQELETQRASAEAQKAETERLRNQAEQDAKRREEAESPYEQARQIALFGVPAAAGLGGGYLEGKSLTKGLRERAGERSANVGELAQSVRSNEIPRSEAARTARNLRLLGPTRHGLGPLGFGAALTGVGIGQRALAPHMTDNPIGQDVIRGLGGLESGVGTGLLLQQIGSMIKGVPQPSARDAAVLDPPPSGPGGGTPPPAPKPAPAPGTRADLYAQAKARGLPVTTRMKKAEVENVLAKALKASSRAAKKLPKALVPGAVGYGVYDALRSPAEAADGAQGEPMSRGEAAGAATAAGGATYGLQRLAQAVGRKAPAVARAAGPALNVAGGVLGAYDYASQAQDARGAMPEGIAGDIGAQVAPLAMRGMQDLAAWESLPEQARGFVERNQSDPSMGMAEEVQAAPPPGMHQMPDGSMMADSEMQPQQAGDADAELEALVAAAEQDPETAQMIRDLINARLGEGAMP